MFRPLSPPIFRSTRLCVTACGLMHPRCCRSVAWKRSSSASRLPAYRQQRRCIIPQVCNTQSSAPEDGRDQGPKHVMLIGIINKQFLLHLVGVYTIYINDARSNKYKTNRKFARGFNSAVCYNLRRIT